MVISLPAETRKILSSELEINHFVKRLPSFCCDNIADNIFLTVNILHYVKGTKTISFILRKLNA